ncbi:hypothetical protein [Deinococcus aquaedulcis]|uniref:hypothetical protein n=1 Tax=Deinococcus aquaedulcis TaxID=2840455 RepID=UPI001C836017|nr:hypothetical protein [Deinococcus aquaedulcis]
MYLRFVLPAALAASLLTTALAQNTPAAPTVVGQPTPEQATQLIERLVSNPGARQQLIYGALPAGLPLTLSEPLTLLASIRTPYSSGSNTRVLLSSAQGRDATLATLGAQLGASGWTARKPYGVPFGFQVPQSEVYRSFYYEPPAGSGGGAYLADLNVRELGGRTAVDLNIGTITAQQLAGLKKQPQSAPQTSLPSLRALPGAQLRAAMNSGSANVTVSSVYVTGTPLSAGEVLGFYSAQLKAAGWKAVTDTTTGPLRVITYALKDLNGREALGTLGLRSWEKGGYALMVSVQGFKP